MNAEEADAAEALMGVQWAREVGIRRLHLEGDCQNVLRAMNGARNSVKWTTNSWIEDILVYLNDNFESWVRRSGVEQGLAAGSWHCATVIACSPLSCTVKYDHHLLDGMTDMINLDHSYNHGCLIRPIPPCTVQFSLHYGLCVDALVNKAWREGVVFDYEGGVSERLVFFPDIGDAQMMKIDELRVTQDWYEVSESWKVRGNWILLDLIEEYEMEFPNVVSVRQIWYDLKQKEAFRNKEWICNDKSMWVDLLWECILQNLDTCVEYALNVLVGDPVEEPIQKPRRSSRMKNCMDVSEDREEGNQFAKSLCVDPAENLSEAEDDEEYYPISFKRRRRRKIKASVAENLSEAEDDEEYYPISFQRRKRKIKASMWTPFTEAKFCPEALANYLKAGEKHSQLEARMHLCYIGWKIEYKREKRGQVIFRYVPPKGGVLYSLRVACQVMTSKLQQVPLSRTRRNDCRPSMVSEPLHSETYESHVTPTTHSKLDVIPEYWPKPLRDYLVAYRAKKKNVECLRRKAKEHLSGVGWTLSPGYVSPKTKEVRYVSPSKNAYRSLLTACLVHCKEEDEYYKNLEVSNIREKRCRKQRKRQKSSSFLHSGSKICGKLKKKKATECKTCVPHSSKRARQVVVPSSADRIPRTVLSWLIEHNVVMPREKVRYLSVKDGSIIGEGEINCNGIKCNCCEDVFGLSNFGRHAGSYYTQPSARIFLQDGRSLLDCQKQLLKNQLDDIEVEPCQRFKRDPVDRMNDDICSICQYGGELVLCDRCPSAFHLNCLGIKDLPDGNWFCPSCQCGICGQSEIAGDSEQHPEKEIIRCDQCNHEFHAGCVTKRGLGMLEFEPSSSWFCGIRCEKLSASLHKLLGKSVAVGVDSLSWTILQPRRDACHPFAPSDAEADMELQSKLNVALGVMHECFEPITEPYTKRDLVKDILFNNTSELNRLNFSGFYTVLLEREDELISVATVRIHDVKVAEVPLVGTRVQYRRQGMCRILLDVLENKLRELEVERLILPAVPQVLQSWTTSFGFSKMSESERLEFLRYTFLDFQDTTMCQKILRMSPAAEATMRPRRNPPKHIIKYKQRKENTETSGSIIIPALIQAGEAEWSQHAEQQQVEADVDDVSDSVVTALPLQMTTTLQDETEQNWHSSEPSIFQECLSKDSYGERQDYQCSHERTLPVEKFALVVYGENKS
ncbi:uncharacterized protein LOC113273268 [Papaver somniferum]|uniref:uncharacterized protein LOC113273268 n=1 Tax=Papaver somniferum TaxID=3469 RepID=UPI000E704D0E|nr:uncharacterized protein LOC113273268 [Papaver somniferum]